MGESAYEAIYTGVYVFIFIIALTVSMLLFNNITEVANLSYEFSNKIEDNATLVDVPVEQNLLLEPYEVLSYYYNYVERDLYSNTTGNSGLNSYKVSIYTKASDQPGASTSLLPTNLDINSAMNAIGKNNKYILRYISKDSSGTINIQIQKATNAEIESFF